MKHPPHLQTRACEAVLGLELLHVLNAVVDEAEAGALASTVVGAEAEQRHRRGVRHTELLLARRERERKRKRWEKDEHREEERCPFRKTTFREKQSPYRCTNGYRNLFRNMKSRFFSHNNNGGVRNRDDIMDGPNRS